MRQNSNLLLESLSPEACSEVIQRSQAVSLPQGSMLYRPERGVTHGYFLTSGIASTLIVTRSGESAEVGLIGHEGVVGSLSLLGPAHGSLESMVQVDATAWKIPRPELQRLFYSSDEIRSRLLQFVQNESLTTIQVAGCQRLHGTEARLARWLLMVQDRVQSAEIKLTHSFLALMLGIRRPTVTLIARSLQRQGALELWRGHLKITNTRLLESIACECYASLRDLYQSLYPSRTFQ